MNKQYAIAILGIFVMGMSILGFYELLHKFIQDRFILAVLTCWYIILLFVFSPAEGKN